MKRYVKKLGAIVLMMLLCLIMTNLVMAEESNPVTPAPLAPASDARLIDENRTGSIIVTKYATTEQNLEGNTGTGMSGQQIPEGYTTIEGVTFNLYKLAGKDEVMAYYNGTSEITYNPNLFSVESDGSNPMYNGEAMDGAVANATTDAQGVCTFSGLEVGIYILKEVAIPPQIQTLSSEACLISIPMVNSSESTNQENGEWMYEIHVYPKNVANESSAKITKVDTDGNGIQDVIFNVYKLDFSADGTLGKSDWGNVLYTGKTNESGVYEMKQLTAGPYGTQYKVVEVSAPDGYIVNSNPVYFYIDKDKRIHWGDDKAEENHCEAMANESTAIVGEGSVDEKTHTNLAFTLENERPNLIKKVQRNPHTTSGDPWKQDEEYQIGETITYKITVEVPKNVTELPVFQVEDTPSAGLTDDLNSIAVTCQGNAFTNFTTAAKDKGFVLTINTANASGIQGKTIEITYNAVLNKDAVVAGDGNANTAALIYTDLFGEKADPENPSTYEIKDEARVYTFQFMLTKKLDSETTGAAGAGVQFELYASDQTTGIPMAGSNGIYRVAASDDTDASMTMTTDTNGQILIKGLESDVKYYLKETKTVADYNLLSGLFEITLTVGETTTWTDLGSWTADGMKQKAFGQVSYTKTNGQDSATIVNRKGFVLPQTGSMGFVLFGIVGLALVAGGLFLLFGGKKRYTE